MGNEEKDELPVEPCRIELAVLPVEGETGGEKEKRKLMNYVAVSWLRLRSRKSYIAVASTQPTNQVKGHVSRCEHIMQAAAIGKGFASEFFLFGDREHI